MHRTHHVPPSPLLVFASVHKLSASSFPPPSLARPSKNGLPGAHVRTLKDCLMMLRKSDKNHVFQYEVPPNFRGLRGVYADVIKNPMDLGTVLKQIDTKYRCGFCLLRVCGF